MTAQQIISARILALTSQGMDVVEAMRQVCGAEKVDAMIASLHDELRAKAETLPTFTHYRIRDAHTGAILDTDIYARRKVLRQRAERMNQKFGAVRYVAEPFNA